MKPNLQAPQTSNFELNRVEINLLFVLSFVKSRISILHKVVLPFESVNEIIICDSSNEAID